MQYFDPAVYPNLAKLDQRVKDMLLSDKAKKWNTGRTEYEISKIHPVYWMEEYGYVRPGEIELGMMAEVPVGGVVRFVLNAVQLQIADRICAHLVGEKYTRVQAIILKHRKAGISTLIAAFDYWHMRFNPSFNAFVIADLGGHTDNIMEMVKLFRSKDRCGEGDPIRDHQPPETLPMPKNKSGLRISNGSMAEQDSGENSNPGTSGTIMVCHMSENAKWRDPENAETSLLNSIPRSGYAFIVKESTAYGINKYAKDCEEASQGKSSWEFIFITWLDMPDCRREIYPGETFKLTREEEELKATYHPKMTDEHIKFRREQIELLGSTDKFKQDFPLNPREPFLITGSNFFNLSTIQERMSEIRFFRDWKRNGIEKIGSLYPEMMSKIKHHSRGETAALDRLERDCVIPQIVRVSCNTHRGVDRMTYVRDDEAKLSDGAAEMYREPRRGGVYAVVVDVAEGKGQDGSIIDVIDTYRKEQVMQWGGDFDEELTATYAVMLAQLYNNAIIIYDAANKCGGALQVYLEKSGYKHIFKRTIVSGNRTTKELGFEVRSGMKRDVYSQFKLDFKNGDCLIHSIATLNEMMFFVDKQGKLEAAEGHKDDRVSTMALGLKVISITPSMQIPAANDDESYVPTDVTDMCSRGASKNNPMMRYM